MEREGGGTRKGDGDCVRLCTLYVDTCARVHTYTLLLHLPVIHTHVCISILTRESLRESSSICRMSIRVKERRGGSGGRGEQETRRRMAEGSRKMRGWTVSREATRECRAVERVCGLCAS